MKGIVATLTHEQQAFVRTVHIRGIAAHGTSFAGGVGIHFHDQAACKRRLVGDVAVQFSKRPLRGMPVCPSLLLARFFAMLALSALSDMCQVLQANYAVWVHVHNTPTDQVVAILFQPSLSSADDHQSSLGGTTAFLLQPLSQSCIMVSFGSDLFARIERAIILGCRCHSQVALPYVHTHHAALRFRCQLSCLDLQGDEQAELLAGFVIPE